MRVTGGTFKGQHIKTSRTRVYRPTQDKVRAAIFNHLGDFVQGASVLDLYCGTGALGIDALSRGAEHAVFCDKFLPSVKITRNNLDTIVSSPDKYNVFRSDALNLCSKLTEKHKKYDLIFVDPPYSSGLYQEILVILGSIGIVADKGIVVVEHSKKYDLPAEIGKLEIYTQKTYGDTMISYYTMES